MTPEVLIAEVRQAGMTIRVDGSELVIRGGKRELLEKLLPSLREHKFELLSMLRETQAANEDEPPADPTMHARQAKACQMLKDDPGLRRAVLADTTSDPEHVLITVAIRDVGVGDLLVPRSKYDPWLFIEAIERHGTQ